MELRMIPMKGKGYMVTARNLATSEESDVCRPLTTDPWDNALMITNELLEQ